MSCLDWQNSREMEVTGTARLTWSYVSVATLPSEQGPPPAGMQVSQRILFVSYRLSTMTTVVSHDIFPWSGVRTYKSQQCCQNSRTAIAESICKVSSWVAAGSGALQCPVWSSAASGLFLPQRDFHSCLKTLIPISSPALMVYARTKKHDNVLSNLILHVLKMRAGPLTLLVAFQATAGTWLVTVRVFKFGFVYNAPMNPLVP